MPRTPLSEPSQALTIAKRSFLTSQIRLLSTPLLPSSSIDLPQLTIEKVLAAVNKKLANHNRLVFGLESQKHVVEQIDALYWRDILSSGLPVRTAETEIRRDVDFMERRGVETLPEEWEDVTGRPRKRRRIIDSGDDEEEQTNSQRDPEPGLDRESEAINSSNEHASHKAARYTFLLASLQHQTQRREILRKKQAQLRRLTQLLRPFEDAKENIQPNLVTRASKVEFESELGRMRVLLARVGGKVMGMQAGGSVVEDEDGDGAGRKVRDETGRLEEVLRL